MFITKHIPIFLVYSLLIIIFPNSSLHARVYKCVDKEGKILFSNTPCPENTVEESFTIKESFTISDETEDEIIPSAMEDNVTGGDKEIETGELILNITQEQIALHPAELLQIRLGVKFVYEYFINVYQLSPNTSVNLKIFGKYKDFMAYQHRLYGKIYTDSGVYSPVTNEALVNGSKYRNRVIAISIHESSHALIQPAGYRIPSWLNEGVAEYFETIKITESQLLFKPQYDRHSEIAALLKEKRLISLLEYFGLTNKVWKNRNLVEDRTSRSIAWSLVHFLMSSGQGVDTIRNIMKNFKIDDDTPSMYVVNKSYPGGLNVLEKRWHEYLKTTPSVHVVNKNL